MWTSLTSYRLDMVVHKQGRAHWPSWLELCVCEFAHACGSKMHVHRGHRGKCRLVAQINKTEQPRHAALIVTGSKRDGRMRQAR